MNFAGSMSLLLAGLLISPHALADDAGYGMTGGYGAGGLVFGKSADIAISRKDLYLSPGQVHVDYVVESRAEEEQTVTVAFPLPLVPATPNDPEAAEPVEGNGGDLRNYVGFGVAVNGRPLIPVLREVAWLDDRNVTSEVEATGLPLLMDDEQWRALQALDPETARALAASGLLRDHGPPNRDPAWIYQAVYEWRQTFPPGETAVSIHYQPLLIWRLDYPNSLYLEGEHAETSCVDDRLRSEIKARGDFSDAAELRYLMTGAGNRTSTIGQFNLTVGTTTPNGWRPSPMHIAVCPAEAATDEQGYRHWNATDFVPEKDIRVLFYFFD